MVDHGSDYHVERFPTDVAGRRADLHSLGDVLPAVLARYALDRSTGSGSVYNLFDCQEENNSTGESGKHRRDATLPVAEMCGGTV